MITLTVNGVAHNLDIDPSMPLLYALRNHLELNGAKFGCGMGQCGACTVIVDQEPVFSCQFPRRPRRAARSARSKDWGRRNIPARCRKPSSTSRRRNAAIASRAW